MKISRFAKKVFFVGLKILSSFTKANSLNAIPLSCISMNNQECKTRLQIIVNGDELVFFPLKQVNVVVVVIILNIHMEKFVFSDIVKKLNTKVFNPNLGGLLRDSF